MSRLRRYVDDALGARAYDAISLLLTLALAIFAGFSWWEARRASQTAERVAIDQKRIGEQQLEQMKIQADAISVQFRPIIEITEFRFAPPELDSFPLILGIKNSGRSSARRLILSATIASRKGFDAEQTDGSIRLQSEDLPSGTVADIPVNLGASFIGDRSVVQVSGTVEYQDSNGKPYSEPWCYINPRWATGSTLKTRWQAASAVPCSSK